MISKIKDKIKDKKLILFGEVHGTKEIPLILKKFFSDFAKEEDFNICLEIPKNFQDNIEDFFKSERRDDSRNSLEYLDLVEKMKEINQSSNRNIKIFCVDLSLNRSLENINDFQAFREKEIAKNILNSLDEKKTFAILGNIHASKEKIHIKNTDIFPVGRILSNELEKKVFSVNILPLKGEFFNFEVKKISEKISFINKGFDHVFEVDSVTPCSFYK